MKGTAAGSFTLHKQVGHDLKGKAAEGQTKEAKQNHLAKVPQGPYSNHEHSVG